VRPRQTLRQPRRYEASQLAPPLLFVHGICHAAWCWDEHFTAWFRERGFETTAIDLLGHGARQGPGLRGTPLSAYIEDVRVAVAALRTPAVLIAHSMGGGVVQRYLSSGGTAAGVVLLAPLPPWGALGATIRYAKAHPLRFLAINATMSFKPMIGTPEGFRTFLSSSIPREELERLQAKVQDESYRAYVDMMLMRSPPRPTAVPTLVMVGGQDSLFTVAVERKVAAYHRAEFEVFDEMGHDLMLDVGWESVAERIAGFVRTLTLTPHQGPSVV
jgi:pimeloyl-ACP methyl ester carboxylesterase